MTPEQAAAERSHLRVVEPSDRRPSRIPAHNLDAEAAVLSAVLLDEKALPLLKGWLEPDDFYSTDNRLIYAAAIAVQQREIAVDVLTVISELRAKGKGHMAKYLAEIVGAAPGVANVGEYARLVLDCSRWRALADTLQRALPTCYAPPGDTEQAMHEIVTRVHTAARRGAPRKATKLGKAAMAALNKEAGLSWGIPELDAAMGHLIAPWLYVIMARPGNGKTALASWTALQVARQGWGVVYFSCDLDRSLLEPRMACALWGIPYSGFSGEREPEQAELSSYTGACSELASLPLFLDDQREPSPATIETAALQIADDLRRDGKELSLIVIDQLQGAGLVQGPIRERWTEAVKLRMTAREYSAIGKRLGVPVLALSQLTQGHDGPYPYGSKGVAQEVDNLGAVKVKGNEMHLDMTSDHCKRRAGKRQDGCWHWYPDRQGF